jgi:hypothetical protein
VRSSTASSSLTEGNLMVPIATQAFAAALQATREQFDLLVKVVG